jgi:rhamnulokinase
VITADARRFNFTNEGGVCGTTRVLKNIAGLWLVQCCRCHWKTEGREFDYSELAELARNSPPLESVIDPDHPSFLKDERMPGKIARFCRATGQPEPTTPGAVVRTALESLALKYRLVLEALETTVGRHFESIRIVGGGAKNELLNQLTADATGRRVLAGPIEATALGNIAMQMLATQRATDLTTVRSIIDASYPPGVFEPQDTGRWDRAWDRFRECCANPPTL